MAERTGAQTTNGTTRRYFIGDKPIKSIQTLDRPGKIQKHTKAGTLTFDEVRTLRLDPTVKLVRRLVIGPAIQAGWSVYAEPDVDPEIKKATESVFLPLHTHVMRKCLLGNMDYGYTPFEKVWEYDRKAKIRKLKKLKHLLQPITEVLVYKDGSYAGLRNHSGGTPEQPYVDLEVEETLLVYQDEEGTNWYGESDLISVKPVCDKYSVVEAAADRYDAKVTGTHWIIYYPVGTTDYNGLKDVDNSEIASDILRRIESTGTMKIPRNVMGSLTELNELNTVKETGWKVELLESVGAANTQMIARMKYLDTLKVRSFGFPERSVLEGQHGTLAEAEAHGDMATLTINTRRIDITLAVNWHCVNHFLRINWGEDYENRVYLVPNPVNDISIKFKQSVYQTLLSGSQVSAKLQQSLDSRELASQLQIPTLSDSEIEELPPPTQVDINEQQRPKDFTIAGVPQ